MANVRDSDTSLWLHNKLGTSNDSWTGGSICSQLSPEVLRNVKECFPDLQTQVKLKLLLSLFHIPQRNVLAWKTELEDIFLVAQEDSDRWVSVIGEMMKTIPRNGMLNDALEIPENKRIFDELIAKLRGLMDKSIEINMLPMECQYLNKSILKESIGQTPVLKKLFNLKRKPKAAVVKVELTTKCMEMQSNAKKHVIPTVPVRTRGMPRKMTDTTPLKGIPSNRMSSNQNTFKSISSVMNSNSAVVKKRKGCAIKLLEITEQPMSLAAKKRKRLLELEEAKQRMLEESSTSAGGNADDSDTDSHLDNMKPPPTPDYAAGLIGNPPTPAIPPFAIPSTPLHQPMTPMSPMTPMQPPPTPSPRIPIRTENATSYDDAPPITDSVIRSTKTVLQSTPVVQPIRNTSPPPTPRCVEKPKASPVKPQSETSSSTSQPNQFSLTREQLKEAQEMFRTANTVTRPEKALILGFMAGSRDNPCPSLGTIVTIKLSENQERVVQSDGSYALMNVETHFQMNYTTGEWERIKKYREIETDGLSALATAATTAKR